MPLASLDPPELAQPQPSGANPGAMVILGNSDGRFSEAMIDLVLDALSVADSFKDLARREIAAKDHAFTSYSEFLGFLQGLVRDLIRGGAQSAGLDPFEAHEALSRYRQTANETLSTYDLSTKVNPDAVYWPNPKRDPNRSTFTTLPYIENLGLITKDTPVGSAGSCFAVEIAKCLQQRGFNYVTTESEAEDAANGVFIAGFDPNNPYAQFSANYGSLFNTPSFRQLAEKAFGLRCPKRVLLPSRYTTPKGEVIPVYFDPFRENVAFHSPEAYEANYDKHLRCVREALLRSEFFIVTLGLNECWEFLPDGSVLSRNPSVLDLYPLIRRRVLSVDENIANIQRMIDVVRVHNPDFKVIISLSPIPFLATTRGHESHVIAANAHSKSVLRVAAEELVKANSGVYYFPSYEMVTVCTAQPWTEDQRHVNEATIEGVMALFEAMLVH